jgi:hypothetical protein
MQLNLLVAGWQINGRLQRQIHLPGFAGDSLKSIIALFVGCVQVDLRSEQNTEHNYSAVAACLLPLDKLTHCLLQYVRCTGWTLALNLLLKARTITAQERGPRILRGSKSVPYNGVNCTML